MPDDVVLVTTWYPRGEDERLQRIEPLLGMLFARRIVVLSPRTDVTQVQWLRDLDFVPHVSADWAGGRREAIRLGVGTSAPHLLYADMDRLIRWAETRFDELQRTVDLVRSSECLVIGRTPAAYATHPRALSETEAVSNATFSKLLHQRLDLSAGAKGFSHAAAKFILANSQPERALGTDSEWVILCHRGGFHVVSVDVNGLDWESADRYAETAASARQQVAVAAEYDANPENWSLRTAVAKEIVEAGLDAWFRELKEPTT